MRKKYLKRFADTFFESEENYIVVSIQDLKFEKKMDNTFHRFKRRALFNTFLI